MVLEFQIDKVKIYNVCVILTHNIILNSVSMTQTYYYLRKVSFLFPWESDLGAEEAIGEIYESFCLVAA